MITSGRPGGIIVNIVWQSVPECGIVWQGHYCQQSVPARNWRKLYDDATSGHEPCNAFIDNTLCPGGRGGNSDHTVGNTVTYLCLKILKRQKSVKMKRQRDMPRKRLSEQAIVSA